MRIREADITFIAPTPFAPNRSAQQRITASTNSAAVMSTDSETARVSGLGDGLGGRSTVARLDAGGSLSQEPAAPVVDETSSESGAREGSDAKLQEPLVPTVMEKSVVSKDAASRTPTQRLRRKTLILIFGKHRPQYLSSINVL